MKNMFLEYRKPSEQIVAEAWKSALFVFDTNVLLDLYKYQTETREQLFNAVEALGERTWIPYQVAWEFHRNRLSTIESQSSRLSDLAKALDAAKSGFLATLESAKMYQKPVLVDASGLGAGIEALILPLKSNINDQQVAVKDLLKTDTIRDRLDQLYDGKVGLPLVEADLASLLKDGAERFKHKVPPGYLDVDKNEFHRHGGIYYPNRFGDLIAWKQILLHAKATQHSTVFFITEEKGSDWWVEAKSGENKVRSPRPELIEEASVEGAISNFMMFSAEAFLAGAKRHFQVDVSEAAIQEVRDIGASHRLAGNKEWRQFASEVLVAWFNTKFAALYHPENASPSNYLFLRTPGDKPLGIYLQFIDDFAIPTHLVDKFLDAVWADKLISGYQQLIRCWITPKKDIGIALRDWLTSLQRRELSGSRMIIFCTEVDTEGGLGLSVVFDREV